MTGGQTLNPKPLCGCSSGHSAAGRGGKRARQDRDVPAEDGGAAADNCSFHLHYLPCRGIDVVRNKIKMFAQKKVTLPPGRHKIVILDEADRCSADPPASAQQLIS